MKTKFNILCLAIMATLAISTLSGNLMAAKLNKTYSKEFAVSNNTQLYISNRFGLVQIENWEKNAIAIEVEVLVEHSSTEKAERMLEAITVSLEQVGTQVRGITEIDERLMKLVGNFNFGSSTKDMQINYKIRMPKSVNSVLRNKYGDMFIDELTGLTDIDLKYGNLKANRIVYGKKDTLSTLKLGYGNASIDEVDWMSFSIKYANLSIVKGQAVVIVSKYSKLNFDSVNSAVIESKYDNVYLGTIANIVAESGYTNYKIKELTKSLSVVSRYGDVKIENVANTIQTLSFEGAYSSIYAPIHESVSYNIDGEVSYGEVYYNNNYAKVNLVESNRKVQVNGVIGQAPNPSAKVIFRVRYGSARLK
ncbi:MAG: hypothetical protein RBR40_02690 [Tenuifilaceae bacterium]|nr:hypothetical protein [Tenuifilaceae bacterium]